MPEKNGAGDPFWLIPFEARLPGLGGEAILLLWKRWQE